jgi:hypothetical protein
MQPVFTNNKTFKQICVYKLSISIIYNLKILLHDHSMINNCSSAEWLVTLKDKTSDSSSNIFEIKFWNPDYIYTNISNGHFSSEVRNTKAYTVWCLHNFYSTRCKPHICFSSGFMLLPQRLSISFRRQHKQMSKTSGPKVDWGF